MSNCSHSRSRSPSRSRSHRYDNDAPHTHSHRHHRHHHRHRSPSPTTAAPVELPFNSRPLTKRDYKRLYEIFTSYLDIQKNLILSDLDRAEAKGRFKRFSRGWYERVTQRLAGYLAAAPAIHDDDEDVAFGPTKTRHGPRAPNTSELQLAAELAAEDAHYAKLDLQHSRRLDRHAQKEALDELIPKADPGTLERRLQKKRELNEKLSGFRERSPGGEVDEDTLMGGGDGGDGGFKARQKMLERKKNERELRREQILKARVAEREERMQVVREKEEKTMGMLKQLAQRFQH